jgi:DNA ligase (NAD+)
MPSPSVEILRNLVRQADAAYRDGLPLMSDAEFDRLEAELRSIAPHAPELRTPGGGVTERGVPMLSLDKNTFSDWYAAYAQDATMVVQPKIDGLALALAYQDGNLVAAWTRSGKCALAVARLVPTIPQRVAEYPSAYFEVHGELYGLDYKQSTPAAALRRKTPSGTGLAFTAYRTPKLALDEINAIALLDRLGFATPDTIICTKPAEVTHLHTVWISGALFKLWPTDGIVVKLLSRTRQDELGSTPIAPRWAHALK